MAIKATLLAETLAPNLSAENSSGLDWTIWNTAFAQLDNQSITPASTKMSKPRHPQTTEKGVTACSAWHQAGVSRGQRSSHRPT